MDRRCHRNSRIRDRPLVGDPNAAQACQRNTSLAETTAFVLARLSATVAMTWIAYHAAVLSAALPRRGGHSIRHRHVHQRARHVVTYNPNRQFLSGDDGLDRFGDFRIQPDANFPGTPTLNFSNGAIIDQVRLPSVVTPTACGPAWNGAELNVDNAERFVEREMKRKVLCAAR